MKTHLPTALLFAAAFSGLASAQINQFDGVPPSATSVLDFDAPFVASGPIGGSDPAFTGFGISSISLVGTWTASGDTLTSASNVNGQVLISNNGALTVGGATEPLDTPSLDAGFRIELSGAATEFGVLFADQINFDYTVQLLLNGGSLGIGQFSYSGSFPRDGSYWTASTGSFDEVIIRFLNAGGVGIDEIAFNNGVTTIGTPYCMANPNSTGAVGAMSATGSASAAANDLELMAADLPANSFGFFIVSRMQGFIANPAGSSGNLCLSGAIGRYVGPGQIQMAGQAGVFSLLIDLTAVPQPNGFEMVIGGETWNFQAWYRDAIGGSTTSNFTQGLEIDFL